MKKLFKRSLSILLCIWMVCLIGITALAAKDPEPYDPVTAVKMNLSSLTMYYGDTAQLIATVEPAGADSRVTWSSSDPKLVSVDANGKLTASEDTAEEPSGKKTATITATSVDNTKIKATCVVTVDNKPATKVASFLETLKSFFTVMIKVFADPSKQFASAFIDFIKKLIEGLPKSS
ncbi:MAG: Ig domain-containing protein [Clostridia bacterium]|nr:Ig domain-containing protein [Clostridia bacterium]